MNESGLEYRPEPVAEFEPGADGGCTIRVMGSDRLAAITVTWRRVRSKKSRC